MKRLLAWLLILIMLTSLCSSCKVSEKDAKPNLSDGVDKADDKADEVRVYEDPIQEALVIVAEAYYARKAMAQYDSGKMIGGSSAQYRREIHTNSPEDITRQYNVYTTCSGFANDVYYEALGIKLGADVTGALASAQHLQVFRYDPTLDETEEKKQEIKDEFFSILQPGDIINYRKQGWGHAMLYIGYDEIIHSTRGEGGDFQYSTNKDLLEAGGTIKRKSVKELFSDSGDNLLSCDTFAIIRPTVYFTDAQITEETKNRIANMQGIIAEKLSSHPIGHTADIGEEITYMFNVKNTRKTAITLEIIDTVPENTTYVKGAQVVEGNTLKWIAEIPASSTSTYEYTVKVNDDSSLYGQYVQSESTVGGVGVNAKKVYIGKNLNADQKAAVFAGCEDAKKFAKQGIDLAREIYKSSGIDIDIPDEQEVLESLFTKAKTSEYYRVNEQSEYFDMLVPTMYGGYKTQFSPAFDGERTRGIQAVQLMAGDILICSKQNKTDIYLYAGNSKILTLDTQPELQTLVVTRDILLSAMGYDLFAVIRPAMMG